MIDGDFVYAGIIDESGGPHQRTVNRRGMLDVAIKLVTLVVRFLALVF